MALLYKETLELVKEQIRANNEILESLAEMNSELQDLLLQSVPECEALGGVVVHPEIAAEGKCTCYGNVCFSKGIIGALSPSERARYCKEVEEGRSPAMVKRVQNWDEAVNVCKAEIAEIPKGERLEPWLKCMGRELPKRGISI
jgi:hypothetical protein